MGTEKTRAEKIEWMMDMIPKIKDKGLLLRNFMIRFASTEKTANEVYNLCRDQKRLSNQKILR